MKLIFFVSLFLFTSVYAGAQCCGDGVCDPSEDSANCPYDCPPAAPGFNCANTIGSFNDSPTWPVNYATAQANSWCYTLSPPYPATICFEYVVPPSTEPVQVSFIHSACNTSSINQGNSPGGCNIANVTNSTISSSATYDANCNLISNNIQTGGCYNPGDIITVCLNINPATTCDPLTICPVISCGTSDCATSGTTPPVVGCPPFALSDTSLYTDLCDFNSGTAVVTPSCGSHFSYLWDDPLAQTDSVISGLNAGTYNVIVSNIAFPGCDTTISYTLPVLAALPNPVITGDFSYCEGETATLDAGGPYDTYLWSTGETTQIINPTSGTGITVTVTNENGCEATSAPVNITGPPQAILNADPEIGIAPLNVTFTNQSVGGTSYFWDFGNDSTLTIGNTSDQQQSYDSVGTYTVMLVTQANGCFDTAIVVINVISNVIDSTQPPLIVIFPNVFTPNGDNANDLFHFNSQNVKSLEVTILNRWGHTIFKSNDINFQWDGKADNGEKVTEGVYFYTYKVTGLMDEVMEGHNFVTVQY